jgi:hypothetical protein
MKKIDPAMTAKELEELVKRHTPRMREPRTPSLIAQMAVAWGVTYETARKRVLRARMAEAQVRTHHFDVHDDDWPKVEKLLMQLRRERAAHEELARATRSPGA